MKSALHFHGDLTVRALLAALGALALLTGCSAVRAERARLYQELATWLTTHTLSGDTVAVSREDVGHLNDWPMVPLPATDDAFTILDTLKAEIPDYVVVSEGVAWDGVRVQSWFRRHYHRVRTVSGAYDACSPFTLYVYRPSPFDTGETITHTVQFVGDDVGAVELKAYRLSASRVLPEVPLYVTLRWMTPTGVEASLRLRLELVDVASGRAWARTQHIAPAGVPTDLWLENVTMTDEHVLVPSPDLPEGTYALRLTLRRPNGQRLRVGPGDATGLTLATLEHPPVVSDAPPPDVSALHATFGEEIELVGYTAPAWAAPGDTVRVVLYWHAQASISKDYKVFVHLLTSDGHLVAQDDSKPARWTYPTTGWTAGEYVRDEHVLTLDPETPWGDWTLAVGMYDPTTETRLPVRVGGEQQADDFVVLQELRVR